MRGVHKTFPGTVANDDVEFCVEPGEVHCLLGENGAGKSTLIKILAGAYRPDSGEILIDGRPVTITSPSDGMDQGISVIYQELDLLPDLTVAQNLALGERDRGALVNRRRRERTAARAIEQVGGRFAPGDRVGGLSVADQQLTAIAKAMVAESRVIVMDEPSATLGERELRVVLDLVRRLAASGTSVIYISHRLNEVKEIGDRATVLRNGRTVATFDVADTSTEELVTAMIGHRPERRSRRSRPGSETGGFEIHEVTSAGRLDVQDIVVRPGQIVGLAGLGGSGRTTLLEALFGAGGAKVRASLDGAPYHPRLPGAAVAAGVGLVPEDRKTQGLLLEASIVRNAALAALQRAGLRPRYRAQRITAEALSSLSVKYADPDQPVGQLSGGNQQKVVFAKWLTRGVKVLLLDEPTRGIDVGAKEELFDQVHRLAEGLGVAVLVASSELSELMDHADLVWVMHEGRNIQSIDPTSTSEEDVARVVVTGRKRQV